MDIHSEHPLSNGQKALWFVQQLDPGNIAHNVVHALQLRPGSDLYALKRAWQRLVDRHPMLRTTFHDRSGEPVQRVHDKAEISFGTVDATDWDESLLHARLAEELYRPFDLTNGPLLRVTVFNRGVRNPIMLTAIHHIITDLWSLTIMLSELTLFYQEHANGKPADVKPLRFQYVDYVKSQAEMIEGPEGDRLWQYWRQRLSGANPPLNLPMCSMPLEGKEDRGEALQFSLPGSLTQRLDLLAKTEKVSLYVLILAAFQVLLHRYSGQTEVAIGTTKAGRSHKTARVIGYFINPVVLKTDLKGDPGFSDFLHRVLIDIEADSKHDALPFPLLVERLAPPRLKSHSPLFQVLFAWQKSTAAVEKSQMASMALGEEQQSVDVGGLVVGTIFIKQRATPFDWGLWVGEITRNGQKELHFTFEYKKSRFDAEIVQRVMSNFETLLESIVQNPGSRISMLPLLSANELHQVSQYSLPGLPIAKVTHLVHALFLESVHRAPDAIALADSDSCMTYGELNLRADLLAKRLIESGVVPETRVAVFVHRSIHAVASIMAVFKAGGVYLPIDPMTPPERLAFMLEDSGSGIILTEEKLAGRLPASHAKVLFLENFAECPPILDGSEPSVEIHPENGAYAIYTSGTTGQPKAIVVSHDEFASHCVHVAEQYRLTAEDRVLQFAALSFDASLEQIVPTLISGACLVLMKKDALDPKSFLSLIQKFGVSVINLPPAYFHQVAEEFVSAPGESQKNHLRLVIIGGDVLQPETVRLWLDARNQSAQLLNAYGPTEATVTATVHRVQKTESIGADIGRVPVGRPLPGRKAFILDRYGNQVPIGATGELLLGGAGLARGYLGRPDKTAESFIPMALSAIPGERVYRTGDLARYRPDGVIEFMGRLDHQVKVRGFRIELGEIEAELARHPLVRQAVVVAREEALGGNELVAYVAPNPPIGPEPNTLRAFLQNRLAAHMVPAVVISLAEIPLTAGGKIDRNALPPPSAEQRRIGKCLVTARTPIEADLCRIWEEVLGVKPVGPRDNFFELGGHSLKATRLISRIRASFFIDLPLRSLFDTPTVESLSAAIEDLLIAEAGDDMVNQLLSEIE